MALAGVQDKMSARTIAVPVHSRGAAAILNVSPPEFPALVENEHACYRIGEANRLRIPYARATRLIDVHGRSSLLVERFDRRGSVRLAMEDAAQLLGVWPARKYAVSMEEISEAVARVCVSPVLALRTIAFQLAMPSPTRRSASRSMPRNRSSRPPVSTPRHSRDLRRVLASRRRHWS